MRVYSRVKNASLTNYFRTVRIEIDRRIEKEKLQNGKVFVLKN